MSPLTRPGPAPGPAHRWPLLRGADLRVSDAERAEVADLLSRHYSDGRLDEATFHERLDRAMGAVTQSDLAGLLADLPDTGKAQGPSQGPAPGPLGPPAPRRSRPHRVLFLLLVAVIAVAVAPVLARVLWVSLFPWLLIGLIAFFWLKHAARRRNRDGRPSDPAWRDRD